MVQSERRVMKQTTTKGDDMNGYGEKYAGDARLGVGCGLPPLSAIQAQGYGQATQPERRPMVDALMDDVRNQAATAHDAFSKLEVRLGCVLRRHVDEAKNPNMPKQDLDGPELVRQLDEVKDSLRSMALRIQDVANRLEV